MFRHRFAAPILLSAALTACDVQPLPDDPIRQEFLAACDGMKAYASMTPEKRAAYCSCVYDRSMSGLSEPERQMARFYLLEQAGVDVRTRGLVDAANLSAMGKASEAIAIAVRRCG